MLDPKGHEEKILAYWNEHRINQKVKEKNKDSGKPLYFLDGPPFVTGDLHLAQVWTKASKDLFLRYKRYRGFNLIDRAGYDTQGLPAELAVEKNLKITSKKEIEEKIGIENFVNACREYVDHYITIWKNEYERFGISLDFSNPYLPHTNGYMETEWSLFKEIDKKGYLYSGYKTTAYCPRCECVVSQGSMEVEYADEKDPSIFVTFKVDVPRSKSKLKLEKEVFLLVWTTTPWTLPANVAVAMDPNVLYVVAKLKGKSLILAKSRLDQVASLLDSSAVILNEFYGSELEGVYYINALEEKVPKQKELRKFHRILAAPRLVSSEEGTGLVHIAPGHGLDDYNLGMANKLPIFSPVSPEAKYNDDAGSYKGIKIPDEANTAVLGDLKLLGMLEHSGELTHSYPHCWRCHSKVVFIASPQWFFNVQKIKKKLLKANEKIKWHPEEARSWEKDLIENSPDWCISRQRYWATPMPIWICEKCHEYETIGSRRELEEMAINPDYVRSLTDLHRPYIDKVILKCKKCGGNSIRVKDVIDVWFDSSMAFRISLSEEQFSKLFPVEFVIEYIEQIRAWFQYMMRSGLFAFGKSPVKHIVVHGILWGNDGRKMSKSFGNFTPLDEMLKNVTADACRLWLLDHDQIENRNLNENEIKDADKVILTIYNIANLLKEYAGAIDYLPKHKGRLGKKLDKGDIWLVSKYASTLEKVTASLESYNPYGAARAIRNFIVEDLSRFYLKLAKKRIMYKSRKEAKAAIDTINYVLFNTLVMMSPIMPFVSEGVYQEMYKFKESIFLENWPKVKKGEIDTTLEGGFSIAQEAITALLNAREKTNIKLRWPIANATIEVKENSMENTLLKFTEIIEDYVNVKHLSIKKVESFGKEIRPVFTKIGPEFKENAQLIADALKKEDPEKVASSVSTNGHYPLDTERGLFNIRPEHFMILERLEGENAIEFKYGVARVDKQISKELWEEAMVREFERRVQLIRKERQMKKTDRINVFYEASAPFAELIKRNSKNIKRNVGSKTLKEGIRKGSTAKEEEVEEEKLRIEIEKIEKR
jgi:isoleucyl-tRNA synthetase